MTVDKPSKDGKKSQVLGKFVETSGKDKPTGKPGDAKKTLEVETAKLTAASMELRPDTALPDQADCSLDNRFVYIDTHLCNQLTK